MISVSPVQAKSRFLASLGMTKYLSVPADGRLIEINENLFGFEIFFEAPRTELASKAGLLVTAPRSFDVGRLHVIDPDDAGAKRLHDAEGFVNVARPDGCGQTVGGVVGNANGVRFAFEGDDGCDRAEDFFAGDARAVVHVIENSGLDVIAFAKLLRTPATDGDFFFLLAEFEVGADAIGLLFADQRPHFRIAFEGS